MDARRYRYLQAMGIQTWVTRESVAADAVIETVPTPAPNPVPESIPESVQEPAAVEESLPEQLMHATHDAAPVIPANESAVVEPPSRQAQLASLGWDELQAEVASCQRCELAQSRTQTVFGVGNRQAEVLVIGEAPGADEDAQGEPFVGRAGQLLNAMLQAIGLKREAVFIANILKCRPPNNRDPLPEEVAQCEPYLQRQIELIQPKVILAVGRIAVHNLLKIDTPLGRLRGQELTYGPQKVPVVVTYHPAYLLRTPADKAKAWQDLLRLKAMGIGA